MTLARYLPRFRRAHLAQRELADRESWPRQRIELFQLDQLNDLWRRIAVDIPYYRKMRADRSLPDRFDSVREFCALVPALDKASVVARHEEFLSQHPPSGAWHRTSGSTGTPMRVFRAHADHREMLCAKYRFYASWGVDIFDRTAWLWSARDGGKGALAQKFQDRLRNRLRLPADRLDDDALRDALRRIEQFRPAAIYGYSRAIYMLAHAAARHGFRCDSLKFICLTGETATRSMVRFVETTLSAPAIMEYGSVDCGFLGGSSPVDRSVRIRADIAILETLPRADGRYDTVVTALTNRGFPLLRYRIGDVTDSPVQWPDRGMPILGSILGRDDDVLITPRGRAVHATVIDELFESRLAGAVFRYRVHQQLDGRVNVMVQLSPGAGGATNFDSTELAQRVGDALDGARIKVGVVDAIPQTAAGKHRLITSELFRQGFPAGGADTDGDIGSANEVKETENESQHDPQCQLQR